MIRPIDFSNEAAGAGDDPVSPPFLSFTTSAATLIPVLASLLFGAYLQSQVLLSSDVGWLIRSVRLMVEGQRFGPDLFELNLPIVWYLCLPAAWGVTHLGLNEIVAIRGWIWILVALALIVTWVCIMGSSERHRRILFEYTAAAIAASVLAASSFGQREHLAFVLSLPYVFLTHLRSSGNCLRPGPAIAGGVISGIAFSIKPLFVVVPIGIELTMLAFHRRDWKLFRPESLAMLVGGTACLGSVLVFAPDYLKVVVPVAYATYWAYDLPFEWVLSYFPVTCMVFIGWLAALVADSRLVRVYAVWFAAFFAWTLTYLVQSRGFDYHGIPAVACAFVLAVGMSVRLLARVAGAFASAGALRWPSGDAWKPICAFILLALTSRPLVSDARIWFRAATEDGWNFSRAQTRADVIEMVRGLGIGPGDSVLSFSTHPFPAFPTLNYLGADWVGPDMALFPVPAWIRRSEIGDPDRRRAIDAAMTVQRQHVKQALLKGNPDFLFVNANFSRVSSPGGAGLKRIDYFDVFSTDPDVAQALAQYRKIADYRQIQVYARDDATESTAGD